MSDSVLTEFADCIAQITINRPTARNAVDRSVADGIAAAVDEFESRPDLTIAILTGAGGTFCAGMDLKAFTRGETPVVAGRGFGGLTEQPPTKPLIAAVLPNPDRRPPHRHVKSQRLNRTPHRSAPATATNSAAHCGPV